MTPPVTADTVSHHPFRPSISSIIRTPVAGPPSTSQAAGLTQAPPSSQKPQTEQKRGRRGGKKRDQQAHQGHSVLSGSPPNHPPASSPPRAQQQRSLLPTVASPLNTVSSTQQSDLDFGGAVPPSQSTPTQRGRYYAGLMTSYQQKTSGPSIRPAPAASSPVLSEGQRSGSHHGKGRKAERKRKRAASRNEKPTPTKQHKVKSRNLQKARAKSRTHADRSSHRGRSKSRGRSASRARSHSRAKQSSSKRRRRDSLSDSDVSSSDSESESDSDSSDSASESESDATESSDSSDEEISRRSRKRARTDVFSNAGQETLVTFWLKSASLQFERVLDSSLTLASAKSQVRAKFEIPAQSQFRLMCESSLGGQVMLDDEDDMKAFKLRATRSTAESSVISVLWDRPAVVQQEALVPHAPVKVGDSAIAPMSASSGRHPDHSLSTSLAGQDQGSPKSPFAGPSSIARENGPAKTLDQATPAPAPAAAAASPTEEASSQTGTTATVAPLNQPPKQAEDEWVPPSILARRREAAEKAQQAGTQPETPSTSTKTKEAVATPHSIAPSRAVEEVAQQVSAGGGSPLRPPTLAGTKTPWVLEQVSKGHPCGICGSKPWHGSYLCPTLNQGGLPFAERRMQELIDMKQRKKEHERTALRDLKSWVSVIKTGGQAGEKVLVTGEVTVGDIGETEETAAHDQGSQPAASSAPQPRAGRRHKPKQTAAARIRDAEAAETRSTKDTDQSVQNSTLAKEGPDGIPPPGELNAKQAASAVPAKKKPGPKPKNAQAQSGIAEANDKTISTQSASAHGLAQPEPSIAVADDPPTKKKRGRPSQKPQPEVASVEPGPSEPPATKKPGRKPKQLQSQFGAEEVPQQQNSDLMNNDPPSETPVKRGPGRPRKNPAPEVGAKEGAAAEDSMADQTPKQGAKARGRKSTNAAGKQASQRAGDAGESLDENAGDPMIPEREESSVTVSRSAQPKNAEHSSAGDAGDTEMTEASDEPSAQKEHTRSGATTPEQVRSSPRAQRADRRQAESDRAERIEESAQLAESKQEMEAIKARWAKIRKDCESAQKKVAEYLSRQALGETFTSGMQGGFTRGKNLLIRCTDELEEVESEMSDFSTTRGVRRPPKAPELEVARALRNTLVKQQGPAKATPRKSVQTVVGEASEPLSQGDGEPTRTPTASKEADVAAATITPHHSAHRSSAAAAFDASQTPGLRSRQSSSEDDVETSPLLRSVGEPRGDDDDEVGEAAAEDNIPSQPLPPAVVVPEAAQEKRDAPERTGDVEAKAAEEESAATTAKSTSSFAARNRKGPQSNSEDGDSDTSDDSDEDEEEGASGSGSGRSSSTEPESEGEDEIEATPTEPRKGLAQASEDEEEEEDEIVDSQSATRPAAVQDEAESGDDSSSSQSPSTPSPSSAISSRTQSESPAPDDVGGGSDVDASTTLQAAEADPISSFSPSKMGANESTPLSKTSGKPAGGTGSFFSPLNFFQAGRSMGNPFASSSQPQGHQAGSQGSPRAGGAAPSSQPTAAKRSRLGMPRLSELDASMLRRRNHSANGTANGSGTSTPNSVSGLLSPAPGGGSGNTNGFPFGSSQQQRDSGDDEEPDAGADAGSEASSDEDDSGSDSSDSDSDVEPAKKKSRSAKSSLPASKMAASQDTQKKKRKRGLAALF